MASCFLSQVLAWPNMPSTSPWVCPTIMNPSSIYRNINTQVWFYSNRAFRYSFSWWLSHATPSPLQTPPAPPSGQEIIKQTCSCFPLHSCLAAQLVSLVDFLSSQALESSPQGLLVEHCQVRVMRPLQVIDIACWSITTHWMMCVCATYTDWQMICWVFSNMVGCTCSDPCCWWWSALG